MKTRILAGIIAMISMTTILQAQTSDQPKIKCASIRNFYINIGMHTTLDMNANLTDFFKLAPQSSLLTTDFADYQMNGGRTMNSNRMINLGIGLKFANKDRTAYRSNPELRLGFSYYSGGSMSANLHNEIRTPYDTLTSSQTGDVYYVDSVDAHYVDLNYQYDQLRIDGNIIWRTNPEARCSLFAGVGISAGMSIHAQTEIMYTHMKYTDYDFNTMGSLSNYSMGDNYFVEHYKNKNNFGFSAYIPMGVDLRIGNKREFWKRTHLFYEMAAGINFTVIPELRTTANMSMRHGFGLRVSLD